MAIRVFIADDHVVFRNGLCALLESQPDFEVVGEGGSGAETIDALRHSCVDVLLLDITMPDIPGPRVAEAVIQDNPNLTIVVLTMHEDTYYVEELFKIGARGFVLKRSSGATVFDAIRQAAKGGRYIDPLIAGEVLAPYVGQARVKCAAGSRVLTPREEGICALLAYGYTNAEIAGKLHISNRTVETHRRHIIKKLGVRGRAGLVRFAIEQRLMDPSSL